MRPKKIRWIHRKFPRYYQWWWSMPFEGKGCMIIAYLLAGLLALDAQTLTQLSLPIILFGITTGFITHEILHFKKEDL